MKQKVFIWGGRPSQIVKATLITALTTLAARFLGILNYSIVAKQFGTSIELDAFLAVQSLVDLAVSILTISLTVTFIPKYVELIESKNRQLATGLTNNLFTFLFLISLVLTILLITFSKRIVILLFRFNPSIDSLASSLLMYSSLSIVPLILAGLMTSIINSHRLFVFPTLVSIIPAGMQALLISVFGSGMKIYSFSLSVIVTSWIVFILLYYYLYKNKFRFKIELDFSNDAFREILSVSPAILVSASAVQANVLIDRIFSSRLPEGNISALYYARTLRELPLLIATALPLVILPYFAENAVSREEENFARMLSKALRMGAYIIIPSILGMFIVSKELVDTVLNRGLFNLYSRDLTTEILNVLLVGIFFYWCITLITRVFYAKKQFGTTVHLGVSAIVLNYLLNAALVRYFGVKGIALSTVLVEFTFFLIYLFLTTKILRSFRIADLLTPVSKILLSSITMVLVIQGFNLALYENVLRGNVTLEFIKLLLNLMIGTIVYLGMSKLLKLVELNWFIDQAKILLKDYEKAK